MEAKFIITPALKTGNVPGGVESHDTPMLVLTKLSGMGLGADPKAVDRRLDGRLSRKIRQDKFTGELGTHLTLQLGDEHPQRNVLMVGLGSAANYCGLKEVIKLAVGQAVAQGCSRMSIPIPKDRVSAFDLNLAGLGYAIKESVREKLAEIGEGKTGTLEVELVCTPQAKRFLRQGLDARRRKPAVVAVCCDPSPEAAAKSATTGATTASCK